MSDDRIGRIIDKFTNKLYSLLAAVGVALAGGAMWYGAISAAWHIGDWVGGSNPPLAAQVVAFLPTITCTVSAVLCLRFGIPRRSGLLITVGITSAVMSALLFLLTGWSLAMGSIT
ncbi:MAG TPA: hypothetical protein VGK34_00750 [Armatimonadota bacterium]|jgi:hypothetical protein